MKKCFAILVLLAMLFVGRDTAQAQAPSPNPSGIPLSSVLNADGTFNYSSGISGTLDPTGYQMRYGQNGQPVFVKKGKGNPKPLNPIKIYADGDDWAEGFHFFDMNNTVRALAVDASGNIYAGGDFTTAGDTIANFIAKWNGSNWEALGTGMNSAVHALAVDGAGVLYAGGNFTMAGGVNATYIAKWDGASWSRVGNLNDLNGIVYALTVDAANSLYVGGSFTNAAGMASADYVAKWNGTNWEALGNGTNNTVYALTYDFKNTVLYAGGEFTNAGVSNTARIAKWDGSAWSALGFGISNNSVYALTYDSNGDELYVGGSFTSVGDAIVANRTARHIAKWQVSSSQWATIGTGTEFSSSEVRAVSYEFATNTLYLGGSFTSPGSRVARWNGSNWSGIGSGMDGTVYALVFNASNELVAGGDFNTADGSPANKIAKWDNTNWNNISPQGNGVNGTVNAIAFDQANSILYVAGTFTYADGVEANRIAKWDSTAWTVLGSGFNNIVYALTVDNNGVLYAGGSFTSPAERVAKWDGSTWSALGAGITNGTVHALAYDNANNELYVGGIYSSPALRIAKWDGSTWSALGAGVTDGTVHALAYDEKNDQLYAGGSFTSPATRIAMWNGSNWSGVDGGVNSTVRSLMVDTTANLVYVAGQFTDKGNRIATWNGATWGSVGTGANGAVYSLILDKDDNLYAGGDFTTAGGISANKIAKWDGSTWSNLGGGMDGQVNAFGIDGGGNIYAGGNFTAAGNEVSYYFARWGSKPFTNRATYMGQASLVANTLRIEVTNPVGASQTPTIQFVYSSPQQPTSGTLPSGITHVSQYYWNVNGYGVSFTGGRIRIPVGDIDGVTDVSVLRWLTRQNSTDDWQDIGGQISDGYLENTDLFTHFSEFALGSAGNPDDNPLPVELTSFSGASTNTGVVLNWKTASEKDNAGFILYRNGVEIASYETDAALKGQGTKSNQTNYAFTDKEVVLNETYAYKIVSKDISGTLHEYDTKVTVTVTEAVTGGQVVAEYKLEQNYPNPFNPTTLIKYSLKNGGHVKLEVFDILGRVVAVLVNEYRAAGTHEISFDASKISTSGIYFYRLESSNFTKVNKMMLLK